MIYLWSSVYFTAICLTGFIYNQIQYTSCCCFLFSLKSAFFVFPNSKYLCNSYIPYNTWIFSWKKLIINKIGFISRKNNTQEIVYYFYVVICYMLCRYVILYIYFMSSHLISSYFIKTILNSSHPVPHTNNSTENFSILGKWQLFSYTMALKIIF